MSNILLDYQKNLKDLKEIVSTLDLNWPKKDSKEYLFISQKQKDIYYTIFDLEYLKLEKEDFPPGAQFDFFILAQMDENGKIYNYTQILGNYEKIYFYPWLREAFEKQVPDKLSLLDKTFMQYNKVKKVLEEQ
jgi:hypothetical protein